MAQQDEHFTVFLDLLGFSHAIQSPNEQKLDEVLEVLQAFAAKRSEYQFEMKKQSPQNISWSITPAISVFSDHILISIPTMIHDEDAARGTAFWIGGLMPTLLAGLAAKALGAGFLVRGGATVGPLYHEDGVVFGKALVEAHQLESTIAVLPRVVLSQSAALYLSGEGSVPLDADGLPYLDYVREMVLGHWEKGRVALNPEYGDWMANAMATIQKNLVRLAGHENSSALAKWSWMSQKFLGVIEGLDSSYRAARGLQLETIPWRK
jgi:hypothetical protein